MSRFFELFALILVSILTVSSKRLSFLVRGLDSTRVIGGSSCSTDDFPFLVLVGQSIDRYVVKQMCAGTLLTGYLVLTAAHCVSDMLVVVAGQSTNPVLRKVQEQYVHIDFDPSTLDNDIAILKLFVPIEANEYITYVQLPEPSRNINLVKTCHYSIVMGWGTTDPFMYRKPAGLQCVILPVIQNSFCRSLYKGKSISIDDNLICTFSSKKEDACQGDSGGPLVCGEIQEGIISKGLGCAGAYPGIYTRVDRYLDFITQVIAEHNNTNLLTVLRPDLMFALLLSLFLSYAM